MISHPAASVVILRDGEAEQVRGDAQRGGEPAEHAGVGQSDDAALVPRHFGPRVPDPGT